MHEHQLDRPEWIPEDTLELAAAMADRSMAEQQRHQQYMGNVIPQPMLIPAEVMRGIQIGTTVAMLKLIESPDEVMDFRTINGLLMDREAVRNMLLAQGEDASDDNVSELIEMSAAQGEVMVAQFIGSLDVRSGFQQSVTTAKQIADEYGVSISQVYRDEALYSATVRAQFTPESLASQNLAMIEKMSVDFIKQSFELIINSSGQAAVNRGMFTSDELEVEKAAFISELLADEEVWQEVGQMIVLAQNAMKRATAHELSRHWGPDALATLDPELIGQLQESEMADFKLPAFFLNVQKRQDMVKIYALEKGWDSDNLTAAQLAEINQSDAMRQLQANEDD